MDWAERLQDPRANLGAAPIPGGEAAGESVRDDLVFDELEDEFRKLETDGPAAVDWKDIRERATDILTTRSKDVLVGAWLAYALFRLEGYRGLAVGLAILDGMVETHWETLQPPKRRERGRVAAFDWLAERLEAPLQESPPGEADDEAVLAASEIVAALDDALGERLQREQVALGPLIRALREAGREAKARLEAAKAEAERKEREALAAAERAAAAEAAGEEAAAGADGAAAEADAAPSAPPAAPAPPPSASAAPAAPDGPSAPAPAPAAGGGPAVALPAGGDAAQMLGPVANALRTLARAARRADPADPTGYLAARAARMIEIRHAPAVQGGAIQVPPPPPQRLEEIDFMRNAGNAVGALGATEEVLAANPFWLDGLHRSHAALEGLGYGDAAAAVAAEAGAHLRRFPELLDLTFVDGTPLAGPEARDWLASVAAGPSDGGDADPSADALGEARSLAASGKLSEGFSLLVDGTRSAKGGRERLLWRIAQARLAVERSLVRAAVALLDEIDETMDRHGIADWEPDVAARSGELMLRAIGLPDAETVLGEEELATRRKVAFERLARVSVAVAFRYA